MVAWKEALVVWHWIQYQVLSCCTFLLTKKKLWKAGLSHLPKTAKLGQIIDWKTSTCKAFYWKLLFYFIIGCNEEPKLVGCFAKCIIWNISHKSFLVGKDFGCAHKKCLTPELVSTEKSHSKEIWWIKGDRCRWECLLWKIRCIRGPNVLPIAITEMEGRGAGVRVVCSLQIYSLLTFSIWTIL